MKKQEILDCQNRDKQVLLCKVIELNINPITRGCEIENRKSFGLSES